MNTEEREMAYQSILRAEPTHKLELLVLIKDAVKAVVDGDAETLKQVQLRCTAVCNYLIWLEEERARRGLPPGGVDHGQAH